MRILKCFAQDGNALDDCMEQLVEALTQLLDEKPVPAPITGLHSDDTRGIHVVGESEK
jgi:hypothetical protein